MCKYKKRLQKIVKIYYFLQYQNMDSEYLYVDSIRDIIFYIFSIERWKYFSKSSL